MKVCPKCKIAENIVKSYYSEKDGAIYKVLIYSCRNPRCENRGVEEKDRQKIEVLKGE